VANNPDQFTGDPVFGDLAKMLMSPVKAKREKITVTMSKKPNDFKIYGEEQIEPSAIAQMQNAMRLPVTVKGALMADAHEGYGLPIGGVVAAYNAVIPYGVGMDIGCRMCLSVFPFNPKKIQSERNRIHNILMAETRFGLGEFNDLDDYEILDRKEFREIKFLKTLHRVFRGQLGTSGHGNHFVDVGIVEIEKPNEKLNLPPGGYFAILTHSGSRNFGAEICKHYTLIAKDKLGLSGQAAQLAWLDLDTEEGQEYWQAMCLAGDYSAVNHHIIHERMAKALGEKPIARVENHHNFAWKEKLSDTEELIIHRKGATPAGTGNMAIIPGTMASPAYIVTGKGNDDSLQSASHGAGRLMSRTAAKKQFTRSSLDKYLAEKGIELIGGGTDESPLAYKNIHQVMEYQKDLVEVIGVFYPKIVRME
jgi:tRNA-splicing ligase RtcB (3'-phosphate/5'-hydroxy nucleic acid ligase)